jgi:hypothetical protein
MSGDLVMWTDEYEAAPSEPPHSAALLADSEDVLRAVGCALKPTGWVIGPMSAAAGAGVVLAALRLAGWDVVRSNPACARCGATGSVHGIH